ncbi:hypothetical protein LJC00_02705 [Dysgonomonas sp. OttesenSCG-928-M03]|nr:hypothetical protein [Dysgonomonas sp. OttesenSCG-928-M03]
MKTPEKKHIAGLSLVTILAVIMGVTIGRVASTPTIKAEIHTVKTESKLTHIIRYISEVYVDSVNVNQLVELAIHNFVAGLDPHSDYIPPCEIQKNGAESEPIRRGGVDIYLASIDNKI